MPKTIFEKIIDREIPAEIVHEDDVCIAIMNIKANNPGHVMVIPKQPVAEWLQLDFKTLQHVTGVAQQLGKAIKSIYSPKRVELAVVGLEVAHTHMHVFPLYQLSDADHSAAKEVTPIDLKTEADKIRAYLANNPVVINI